MKLKDCKHGIIVKKKCGEVGMIVGITNSIDLTDSPDKKNPDRAIPLVQWSNGETYGIRACNIDKA